MSQPLLSICIPTKDRTEILIKTLHSIFTPYNLDFDEFEVIVSDNSENEELKKLVDKDFGQYPNIHYHKCQKKGFLNSINALEMGNGKLLKLHNDYTIFLDGSLEKFISFVKTQAIQQPLIFFSQGMLRKVTINEYNDINDFLFKSSYWITWSSAFSIWREDFLKLKPIQLDNIFPHTSLLLSQTGKEKFVINNLVYFENREVPTKGGYNLFYSFSVTFLEMIEKLKTENIIKEETFKKIKYDLYHHFLTRWYYNTKIASNSYTYDLTKIKSSVCTYYTRSEYGTLVFLAYLFPVRTALSKLKAFLYLL